MATAYRVAIFTRGTGAYAYTYRGPDGLAEGQVVAVSFRHRLEFGVIAGEDAAQRGELVSLCTVEPQCGAGWGALLLTLCRLAVAGADDMLGHLAFATGSKAISASLLIEDPERLPQAIRGELSALAGKLTPARRKKLAALDWEQVCGAVQSGAARIELAVAGQPGTSRARPDWKKLYLLKPDEAKWLGLSLKSDAVVPGSYLAGFSGEVDETKLTRIRRREVEQGDAPAPQAAAVADNLAWREFSANEHWEIVRRGILADQTRLRSALCSWPGLRAPGGLTAELAASVAAGQRVLVVVPQEWMLDRLWPALLPLAGSVARYRSDLSPGAVAFILGKLDGAGGFTVCGPPSAWKLAAYAWFDRVMLVDPTHPQYTAETYPHLDPRSALMLTLGRARLDLLELGLSIADGSSSLPELKIYPQHGEEPGDEPPSARRDMNPLPLDLRQPGTRRLIYFNRLGSSRGFVCMECHAPVGCPDCASGQLRFSAAEGTYTCANCKAVSHGLRCAKCGLANIAIRSPGLEAVELRKGDYVATSRRSANGGHGEYVNVLGTSQLLRPFEGYWPEQVVYVHAESQFQVLDDWTAVADMTARLCSLYASPKLGGAAIVSERLQAQLGESPDPEMIRQAWSTEQGLRKLALLPPFGSLFRFRIVSSTRNAAILGRKQLGSVLARHPGTSLLRVSHAHPGNPGFAIGGYFINQQITGDELLELAEIVGQHDARLLVNPLMGPWL